ncbi:MAG: PqqD family protein [Clostridia bacterium]|nr:PqqD family protein [Clostridia bacterium]
MKIRNGFVLRVVGGESVVVPVGEMSKKFHGMINLNETGAFLWKFFTVEHTVEEGVQALLAEYEVEEELARKDVETFVNTILENGFAE